MSYYDNNWILINIDFLVIIILNKIYWFINYSKIDKLIRRLDYFIYYKIKNIINDFIY